MYRLQMPVRNSITLLVVYYFYLNKTDPIIT